MAGLPWIGVPPAPRRVGLAGLGQALLLLSVPWVLVPGSQGHDYLRASAVLGLSLLPIGWGWRLPWVSFSALAWGAAGLLLSWQRQRLGLGPDGVGSITILPLVLASLAAATGQWINLGLLPLQWFGQGVRAVARLAIAGSLLLLLAYLGGGVGVVVALALLGMVMADLAFTALTLLLGAIGSRRGG